MKANIKNLTLCLGLAVYCMSAPAAMVSNQTPVNRALGEQQGSSAQAGIPSGPAVVAPSLAMLKAQVKSVDQQAGVVVTADGRRLSVGKKTMIFRSGQKGSIYSISAGMSIEFAYMPGVDEAFAKTLSKQKGKKADEIILPISLIHVYPAGARK